MTELLYMQAFDVESCQAVIKTVAASEDGRVDIELGRTCFYPRGGGQDWDTGIIKTADAQLNVEEVRLDENSVVHHIGSYAHGALKAGDEVDCVVDHDRRVVNTRLH